MTDAHHSNLRAHVLQVYYYNTLTNESSWEKPKDYAGDVSKASAQLTPVSTQPVKGTDWSEVVCADGRKYYFNGSTQAGTPGKSSRFGVTSFGCVLSSMQHSGWLEPRKRRHR